MRRCDFLPPDKTSYPVPGSDAAIGKARIDQRMNPKPAKAVGYPTSDSNRTARQQHIGRISDSCIAAIRSDKPTYRVLMIKKTMMMRSQPAS
jgi:hypothetical protein